MPTESASDYIKRAITISFLDFFKCEIDYKFDINQPKPNVYGFVIVLAKLTAMLVHQPQKSYWKEKISLFAGSIK